MRRKLALLLSLAMATNVFSGTTLNVHAEETEIVTEASEFGSQSPEAVNEETEFESRTTEAAINTAQTEIEIPEFSSGLGDLGSENEEPAAKPEIEETGSSTGILEFDPQEMLPENSEIENSGSENSGIEIEIEQFSTEADIFTDHAVEIFEMEYENEVTAAAIDYSGYIPLYVGKVAAVSGLEENDSEYFYFIPETTDSYTFYSTGADDNEAYLYDSNNTLLKYNNDVGKDDDNFSLTYTLLAGETYILRVENIEEDSKDSFYVYTQVNHAGTEEIVTPATCQAEGLLRYVCDNCSGTFEEVIPIQPHKYVYGVCEICKNAHQALGSGNCGSNVKWIMYDSGILEITGSGDMYIWQASTEVPWNAYRDQITSVTVGTGVTFLGHYTFYNCPNLSKVILADSITNIGQYAFSGCTSLKGITLPASLQYIQTGAFSGTGLTSVGIPRYVNNIGNYAFSNCKDLWEITVSVYNEYYMSEYGVLYTADMETLLQYPMKKIAVTNGVSGAFAIPEGVTQIKASAFSQCTNVTKVIFPESLKYIGEDAFNKCTSLTELEFPSKLWRVDRYSFNGCNLDYIKFPTSLYDLASYAFANATVGAIYYEGTEKQWKSISFNSSNGVIQNNSNIYYNAFGSCGNNVEYEIFNKVLTISGAGAMTDYASYSEVPWYGSKAKITGIVVEDGVTSIGDYAFYNHEKITSVSIGKDVKVIGKDAFNYCNLGGLSKIVLPEGLTTIRDNAFWGCTYLTSMTIPSSVTSIGKSAFKFCDRLKLITFEGNFPNMAADGEQFYRLPSLTVYYPANNRTWTSSVLQDYGSNNSVTWIATCSNHIYTEDSVTYTWAEDYSTCTAIWNCANNGCQIVKTREKVNTVAESIPADCSNKGSVTYTATFSTEGIPEEAKTIETPFGDHKYDENSKCTICGHIGGFCGENLEWTLSDGVLTIFGNGQMETAPWKHYGDQITEVKIDSGVESIVENAFTETSNGISEVVFLGNAPEINDTAFSGVVTTCYYPAGNATWSGDVKQNYGGNITWIATCGDHVYDAEDIVYTWSEDYSQCTAFWNCANEGCEIHKTETAESEVVTVDASCENTGSITYTVNFTIDGVETQTKVIEIPARGHKYEKIVVTEPTCTEAGYTTHICACGDSYITNYVSAKKHSLGDWKETKAPTCTEAGEKQRACENANCDYVETEVIKANGHKYETEVVTEPTCTEIGYTTHTCACGDSYISNYVGLKKHSLGEWTETKAPTCTEAGEKQRACENANCDYTETEVIKANGHEYETEVVTAPSCTEAGYTTHTCACGDSYISNYVGAKKHNLGDWKETKAPTCTEAGEKQRACENANCDYIETEEIKANGHKYETEVVTDPTCTEEGQKRKDCANCEYFETEVIKATGHEYEETVTAPSCTEAGYTTHTCECGDSYISNYVGAKKHSLGEWTETKAPTCTEAGEKQRACENANCDYIETEEIKANGHKYETEAVTEPTCTSLGYTTYTCVCGNTYKDAYVDALGHVNTELRDAVSETYTKEGYTGDTYCLDCQKKIISGVIIEAPGLPKPNVTVSNASNGTPVLKWTDNSEAKIYYIYRSTTTKSGTFKKIGSTENGTYNDTSASVGKTYYYKVRAIASNSKYNSAYSAYDKAYSKCAAPSVTLSVNSSTGKPVIKWNEVTGAKNYKVYRSTSKSGTYNLLKTTTSVSYTDTSAEAGKTYYYKVRVISSNGSSYNSAYSTIKNVKCKCAKPVIKVVLSNNKPRITWEKVSGATKYDVYRSTTKSSGYQKIKTTTAVKYTDTTAKSGTTYYYKVVAVNSTVRSAYSTAVKITSK